MFNESAFDPENVINYEAGLKSEWLERRLRLNAAAFSSKLDDMQVNYSTDQTRPQDALVINAGSATINGVELEVRYLATSTLELGLDYSYLDAKIDRIAVLPGSVFDSAVNPASTYPAYSNMAALFNVPRTPENSFSVSADNSFGQWLGGEVSLHLDYRWQDEYSANQNSTPAYANYEMSRSPAYGLLNARLSSVWQSASGVRTTVSLWGNNVLDEKYLLNSATFGYGTVPGSGGNHSRMDIWAQPATYGISLACEF